jgi:hypothetical protein
MLKFSPHLKSRLVTSPCQAAFIKLVEEGIKNGDVWVAVPYKPKKLVFRSPQKHHPLKRK